MRESISKPVSSSGAASRSYDELGRLCLAMGERSRAAELFAQSVEMSGQLPDLPLPQTVPDANAARS